MKLLGQLPEDPQNWARHFCALGKKASRDWRRQSHASGYAETTIATWPARVILSRSARSVACSHTRFQSSARDAGLHPKSISDPMASTKRRLAGGAGSPPDLWKSKTKTYNSSSLNPASYSPCWRKPKRARRRQTTLSASSSTAFGTKLMECFAKTLKTCLAISRVFRAWNHSHAAAASLSWPTTARGS